MQERVTPVTTLTAVRVSTPVAEVAPRQEVPGRLPRGLWVANLVAVVVPVLGLAAAAVAVWGRGFSLVPFGLLLGLYVLTALGITAGFHRLFTRQAVEPNRVGPLAQVPPPV